LAFQKEIVDRIEARIGWFTGQRVRSVRLPGGSLDDAARRYAGFTIAPADGPPPESPMRPKGLIISLSGYESHVRVVAGRLPQPALGMDASQPIEVAMPPRGAEVTGLKPGDRFQLADSFDDCERHPPRDGDPPDPPCTPRISAVFSLPAVLVGTIEPLDPKDPYWRGESGTSFAVTPGNPLVGLQTPLLVPEQTVFGRLASLLPEYPAEMGWHWYADPGRISTTNYRRADQSIIALRDELFRVGVLTSSPLENTLADFKGQLSYTQTPLLLLLLQIAGIALFYVSIVAATAIEREAEEIALLRSRGATLGQVLLLSLLEGALIGLPALLLAPPLATAAVALLGRTPTFHQVTHGAALPAQIVPLAYPLALGGVLLSLLALLLPAFLAARQTGVSVKQRQARPRASIIRRYYLDLALVGLSALLLVELNQRGSVFVPTDTGGLSSDPLLLLSPALLTLSAAALILRCYPLVLRLLGRLVASVAGVSILLGLWQMVRNSGQYTRLVLLLMMGVSVGTFAASYSGTATRSFRERILYSAGVDLRATGPQNLPGATGPAIDQALKGVPGLADSTSALRVQVITTGPGQQHDSFQLLGVEPTAASRLLWSRPGLEPRPLATMLEELRATGSPGIAIAGQPVSFSVWVNPTSARTGTTVWARLVDGQGHYLQYELGQLDFGGWRQMRAPLIRRIGDTQEVPIYPLTLA
ncbi:MAG: FtsX-like permease family protein, partial [Dehalococcoidia bacterium]